MDTATAIETVRALKEALERTGVSVQRIILFGSTALGTATDESDIDVAVVSETFRGLNHWERIERMTDALYERFQPIEARALTPEEWESSDSITAAYIRQGTAISI
jgi:uncharacterized protein